MKPYENETLGQAVTRRYRQKRKDSGWIRRYRAFYEAAPSSFPWNTLYSEWSQLVKQEDRTIARTARDAITLLGDGGQVPLIVSWLNEDGDSWWDAVQCLSEFPQASALDRLIKELKHHPRPMVRNHCANAIKMRLGTYSPARLRKVTRCLLDRVEDPNEHVFVREECVEALGYILGWRRDWKALPCTLYRRVKRALLNALRDPSVPVRFFACYSVGILRLREALPILRTMEDDPAYYPHMRTVGEEARLATAWIHGKHVDSPPYGLHDMPVDWPTWE